MSVTWSGPLVLLYCGIAIKRFQFLADALTTRQFKLFTHLWLCYQTV